MACATTKSVESRAKFAYYKIAFVLDITQSCDYIDSIQKTYCTFLDNLKDGLFGYGRIFSPSDGIECQATGHFVFVFNEVRQREWLLICLKQMTRSISTAESNVCEISEQKFIEEVGHQGWIGDVGWLMTKKKEFGSKDSDNWTLFKSRLDYLIESVHKYRRW